MLIIKILKNLINVMALDKIIQRIIKRLSQEEGIPLKTVEKVIRHNCDWTREQFIAMDYPSIRWNKFGTFTLRRGKLKDENLKSYDEFRSKTSKKYKNYLIYIKNKENNGSTEKTDQGETT